MSCIRIRVKPSILVISIFSIKNNILQWINSALDLLTGGRLKCKQIKWCIDWKWYSLHGRSSFLTAEINQGILIVDSLRKYPFPGIAIGPVYAVVIIPEDISLVKSLWTKISLFIDTVCPIRPLGPAFICLSIIFNTEITFYIRCFYLWHRVDTCWMLVSVLIIF